MGSNSSLTMEFIDTSLSCAALSYKDSSQKLIIRDHLLALLLDFPSLEPSCAPFTHNDGTTVNLLNVSGHIPIPRSATPVPLLIWVHQNYPNTSPMPFVAQPNLYRIRNGHPHVDPSSGSISSPYLLTWTHKRKGHNNNLSKLVQNIVNLFSYNHPLEVELGNINPSSSSSLLSHPCLVSRQEAIDRLTCRLHYDLVANRNKAEEELEALSVLQGRMSERVEIAKSLITALEEEKQSLERRVGELMDRADCLMDWVNDANYDMMIKLGDDNIAAFGGVDDVEETVLGCLADDMGMDDVMYELDRALNQGVIQFRLYIKQVRELSRQQFFNRALLVKLRGTQILHHYCP